MRLVPLFGVALATACAHTVTNEQRLEGMTDVTVNSTDEASELRCRDGSPEIQIARDATQKKSERVARYQWAVAEAKGTFARFEDAFRKDADLVYGPKGDEWKRRQAFCQELAATLQKEQARVELEAGREEPVFVAKPTPKKELEKEEPAAPAKKSKKGSEKSDKSEKAETATASAADDAFGDDADSLRSAYKKNAKVAKAKSKAKKKKKHELAVR